MQREIAGGDGCEPAQQRWVLVPALGTGAAQYPLPPVPDACVVSGPLRWHWAVGQKRAMQRGCHAARDDVVIIITNTAIIFINPLLGLGVSSPGLAV